jgi:hypothetical protein
VVYLPLHISCCVWWTNLSIHRGEFVSWAGNVHLG